MLKIWNDLEQEERTGEHCVKRRKRDGLAVETTANSGELHSTKTLLLAEILTPEKCSDEQVEQSDKQQIELLQGCEHHNLAAGGKIEKWR